MYVWTSCNSDKEKTVQCRILKNRCACPTLRSHCRVPHLSPTPGSCPQVPPHGLTPWFHPRISPQDPTPGSWVLGATPGSLSHNSGIPKKNYWKRNAFIEIRNRVLFTIFLWRNYTNKFFIYRYLLDFRTKCLGGQIKDFSFLFWNACDAKSTKGGEH